MGLLGYVGCAPTEATQSASALTTRHYDNRLILVLRAVNGPSMARVGNAWEVMRQSRQPELSVQSEGDKDIEGAEHICAGTDSDLPDAALISLPLGRTFTNALRQR